ncbi:MAG TPA: cupin domain-containing protein [Rhodanobacter sp.]
MPKIDISRLPERRGSDYPPPFADRSAARVKQALGDAGQLGAFGVNLTRLPPGAWSSQRHWHSDEDEFVYVLAGELTLVTDAGEQQLCAHESAAFPKNQPDGHHLINRGTEMAIYLEVGSRSGRDHCHYPDIDLDWQAAVDAYTHKDGSPYAGVRER